MRTLRKDEVKAFVHAEALSNETKDVCLVELATGQGWWDEVAGLPGSGRRVSLEHVGDAPLD
jgi:hypothetical protein